jgi:tetratricopeptide (TPR) repeat protein
MMRATILRIVAVVAMAVLVLVGARGVDAEGLRQGDDPSEMCTKGVELFREGKHNEALPLLEAGFEGREDTTFDDPDDLGLCALALGRIYENFGDLDDTLNAYAVALAVFQESGNREWESITLTNIGNAYYDQARYDEALEHYQQALIIAREEGNQQLEADLQDSIDRINIEIAIEPGDIESMSLKFSSHGTRFKRRFR